MEHVPRFIPPPKPVILSKRADPPALIFASRRSFRMRAWSAALEGAVLGVPGSEEGMGVTFFVILKIVGLENLWL